MVANRLCLGVVEDILSTIERDGTGTVVAILC